MSALPRNLKFLYVVQFYKFLDKGDDQVKDLARFQGKKIFEKSSNQLDLVVLTSFHLKTMERVSHKGAVGKAKFFKEAMFVINKIIWL